MADKLDIIISRLEDMKDSHGLRLDKIDSNLAEHMKRTLMLEDRVEKLEEPKKALKYLKGIFIGIGALAGVVLTVHKLIQLLGA